MAIILGKWNPSKQARSILGLEPLATRRETLCQRFAKKTLKSRHANIFEKKTDSLRYNLRFKQQFVEPKCNTQRFYDSPINFLTRILNQP